MPQREDLPPITGDLNKLKRDIKAAIDEIEAITDRRSNVAADKKAVVKRLEKRGVNTRAFNAALQYASWGERARQNFDIAYGLVREVIGQPLQSRLDLEFTGTASEPKVAPPLAGPGKPKVAAVS